MLERIAADDQEIVEAVAVYDNLNATEQREVFRTVYLAVAAYRHCGDVDLLVRLSESLHGMVVLETRHPEAREQIRAAAKRKTAREAGGIADTAGVIAMLTAGVGGDAS